MKVEKSPTLSASAGKSNGKTKRGFLSASGTNGSQSSSLFPANSIAQVEGASIIPPSEQLKFEGYCAKTGGKYLYYLAVLFSLGLVWLINRWYPDLSVKISNTRCQLRDVRALAFSFYFPPSPVSLHPTLRYIICHN